MKVLAFRKTILSALLCGAGFLQMSSPLQAQNYEQMPVAAEMKVEADRKAAETIKNALLRGQASDAGADAAQKAELFYSGYLVPGLTNKSFGERARSEIQRDMKNARTQEIRDLINRSIDNPLRSIVDNDKYSPASRVAALILIGEMDSEALDATAGKPPKPYRNAITFLRTQLTKQGQTDGLLAAALVGLQRHARYSAFSWAANGKEAMAGDLITLLNQPRPIQRTPEAHAYLQRMAIETLTYFTSSKHGEVLTQLVAMVADAKQPAFLRAAILRAIPRWQLDSLDAPSREKILAAATYLAKSEIDSWFSKARSTSPSSGGFGMLGGMGDGMEGGIGAPMGGGRGGIGAPMGGGGLGGLGGPLGGGSSSDKSDKNLAETQDPETNAARRKLYIVLESVYLGLDGKTSAEDKKPIGKGLKGYYPENDALIEPTDKLLAELDKLFDSLGDKSVTDMRSLANVMESPIDKFNVVADSIPGMSAYKKEIEKQKKAQEAEMAAANEPGAPDNAAPGAPADAPAAGDAAAASDNSAPGAAPAAGNASAPGEAPAADGAAPAGAANPDNGAAPGAAPTAEGGNK